MKKRFLSVLVIVCLLLALSPATGLWAGDVKYYHYTVHISGVYDNAAPFTFLERINAYRAEHGLDPVVMDETLLEVARQRAAERTIIDSTTRPMGRSFFSLIPEEYKAEWENGAWEHGGVQFENDPEALLEIWKGRENDNGALLKAEARSAGVACFMNNGHYAWVYVSAIGEAQVPATPTTGTEKDCRAVDIPTYFGDYIYCNPVNPIVAIGEEKEVPLTHYSDFTDQLIFTTLTPSEVGIVDKRLADVTATENGLRITGKSAGKTELFVVLEPANEHTSRRMIYIPLEVTGGAQTLPVFGDVDADGDITSTDARLVLQYYAGKIRAEELDLSVADADGDGQITSTDARLLLQKYAEKI